MPWRSQLLSTHPIIETCYSGLLSKDELFDAFGATVALAEYRIFFYRIRPAGPGARPSSARRSLGDLLLARPVRCLARRHMT